ncbi:transcription termination factor Rho [Prauserella marina]|uniref:Transcription termination factor Rho n=1 Tax=Prauserella marina TaxID=530584 RepID=A0A222VV51_9PSEU|nr:transcription termination factor Rho [Prauserella marina]ASR37809.1 transcription termination factor Rho [Prauserella marina]PWV75768.1 transcription termination factor Rho [Prauserella marina]SDD26663.1 transcription termination factor Rho [Prauserella marina]
MSNTDLLSGDVNTQASPGSGEQAPQSNGAGAAPKRRPGGLSGMVIAELRALATELGVGDTTGMRKGDLIAAIRERQGKTKRGRTTSNSSETLPLEGIGEAKAAEKADAPGKSSERAKVDKAPAKQDKAAKPAQDGEARKSPVKTDGSAQAEQRDDERSDETGGRSNRRRRGSSRPAGSQDNAQQRDEDNNRGESAERGGSGGDDRRPNGGQREGGQRNQRDNQQRDNQRNNNKDDQDDDERGGRRGRRFRDRRRRGGRGEGSGGGGTDTEIRDDDVLLPVAGILDVLDNYAFVRTSGYLPGPNDVYVSLSLVRKHGLRRGDAITGVVKQPKEGEQQRQKFNPLVRVDSVNGLEAEVAKKRPEFHKLTPLYPNERLRLETQSNKLTTRVIDLVMPVGKGQRALIVSPPKAGKTTIMQDIANAITTNNPECHLMVVLVDERPEEVTDMQRSVQGEVIASTFDRPPSDHTSVAELSIERAKRLVEMGHDVVVLLDSITRLGRAYNLAAPASGRILSGGVDSTALFPPKRFLGAARNIEDGGSLTIFATAMVETGSTGDTVIFEEFKGTGNAELKLDRKIAERRVFPAVDVNPSGTRKEELLLSPDELAVTHKLHRVLHALDSQQAIDLLIDRLRKTKTNIEFLMQVSKTAPGNDDD